MGIAMKYPGDVRSVDYQRSVLERLDQIILLLQSEKSTYDELLRSLTSAQVPMSPSVTFNVTVGTTATLLVQNTSLSLMHLEITNNDFAQEVYLGGPDVLPTAGRRLEPADTIPYNLPIGKSLYGIVRFFTISVIVSKSESPYATLKQGEIVM